LHAAVINVVRRRPVDFSTLASRRLMMGRRAHLLRWLLVLILLCANCTRDNSEPRRSNNEMQITSSAFAGGSLIPAKYTCDGNDLSPPIKWSGAPAGTKSFAVVCNDPDAPMGNWVHWVVFNIPATTTELAEALPINQQVLETVRQGINDFKKTGYGGPCPPPGDTHHYHFRIYALDTMIGLSMPTKLEFMSALEGHVLAEGELIGTYKK
jgi:Raf kinase inhibitor-like YbhB/YbcL family protein